MKNKTTYTPTVMKRTAKDGTETYLPGVRSEGPDGNMLNRYIPLGMRMSKALRVADEMVQETKQH